MKTQVVWSHRKILWLVEYNSAGDNERRKKEKETKKKWKDNIKESTEMRFGASLRQWKTGKGGKVERY